MQGNTSLPSNISKYIEGFDGALTEEEFNSPHFAYRVLFVPKTVNHKGQADRVIEFVKSESPLASHINAQFVVIKETERPKYRVKDIVAKMKEEGYKKYSTYHHTELWKLLAGKNPSKGYGVLIAGTWYWYDSWIEKVKAHCIDKEVEYK